MSSQTPEFEDHNTENIDKEKIILQKCAKFMEEINSEFDITCGIITMVDDTGSPIVYHEGSQLDYTELAVVVASRMRDLILKRIGGGS